MAAVKKGLWGRDSIVEFLIKRGADVNAKDDEGKTVLMHAVERFHVELVKTLIEKGADVNSRSNDGSTALNLAQKKSHNKVIVELLKAHGAKD
jgi:ankyrin repeat protein